jgi:hypothetical protein
MENVELQIPFDEIYRPALSIPVNECQRFSTRPLSWLHYVTSTIYGGGEGDTITVKRMYRLGFITINAKASSAVLSN